jgi:hypothetical protein
VVVLGAYYIAKKKEKRLKLFVKFSCLWVLIWFFNPFANICNVSKIGYCFMKLGYNQILKFQYLVPWNGTKFYSYCK